jgi:RES domain-containing protein
MSDLPRFRSVLRTIDPTLVEGRGYRSTAPKYANPKELLSGEGSRRFGGRWNPIGLSAVYLSDSPETALAESLAYRRRYGLPIAGAFPQTLVSVLYRVKRTIDLQDGRIRRRLRLSAARMIEIDWRPLTDDRADVPTQQIAVAAVQEGFAAMFVPSAARRGGANLVVFPANFARDDLLRIDGVERL